MNAGVGKLVAAKMGRPLRPCPPDFEAVFILLGWMACADYYRTRNEVVRRWMEETGHEQLRARRADFVRAFKSARNKTPYETARQASHYLSARAPNLDIFPSSPHCWEVAEIVISDAEIASLATALGFPGVSSLRSDCGRGQNGQQS